MITVVVQLTCVHDRINELAPALMDLIENTRQEHGCRDYKLYQNGEQKNNFVIIEEWSDRRALDEHMQTDHFFRAARIFQELLFVPPDIRMYDLVY
ncbi:MAG: putative quinol monooxygenase [Candidatus Auribacterota bacterium]